MNRLDALLPILTGPDGGPMPRDQVPADQTLCDYCVGKCCRYISLPIPKPKTWDDFDEIRWFLSHENLSVYVDDGTWHLMVHSVCRHLRDDYKCGIYPMRPKICRDYSSKDCEYEDRFTFDQLFETDDQVFEYAEALLGPYLVE